MEELSSAQQDYLEALLRLERGGGDGASLSDLARALGVKPASASQMVARLKDGGLVTQAPRDMIHLTRAGRTAAEHVETRHTTVREFLTKVLNVPPDVADGDACKVEHALAADTFNRLRDFMDHIGADDIERDNTVPLPLMHRGGTGLLRRIAGGGGRRARLSAMGVHVGTEIRVLQNAGRGPVMIKAGKSRVAIGRGLATCMHVEPTSDL